MKPLDPIDDNFEPRKPLQFSLFSLLSLTTIVAVVLARFVYYPRLAILIAICMIAAIALYFSDWLLHFANSKLWSTFAATVSAIVGTMLFVLSILCHLTYGEVEKQSGAQVWLLTVLLAIGGFVCYYRAWKRAVDRGD
jgi:hypothetical protein